MKLLVDECLSDELTKRAIERGHFEAAHLKWRGKLGAKDWELMPYILDGDWIFVTTNAIDFRGRDGSQRGRYKNIDLHPGLICLNAPEGMDLDLQLELFDVALDEIERNPDLVNQVLEVTLAEKQASIITVRRYAFPFG